VTGGAPSASRSTTCYVGKIAPSLVRECVPPRVPHMNCD